MDKLISEMYEDFIMSEACSQFYHVTGEDTEAQDWLLDIRLTKHIELCKKGAKACKDYLNTKDLIKLVLEFTLLELDENVLAIKKVVGNR